MNNQKIILESLSMDLKRIAIGLHRGSYKMAERFSDEALKRYSEIDLDKTDPVLSKLLNKMKKSLENTDLTKKSEDLLMYSTLIQNYTQVRLKN